MLLVLFDSNIMFAFLSLLGCFLDLVWDLRGFFMILDSIKLRISRYLLVQIEIMNESKFANILHPNYYAL